MKLGLQVPSFTWPGGDAKIGSTLAEIARTADGAGYDSIWVMDHFFQIRNVGTAEEPMLEGYTPELPDWAFDQHTIKGKAMGRGLQHFREEGAKLVPPRTADDPYEDEAYRLWAIKQLGGIAIKAAPPFPESDQH